MRRLSEYGSVAYLVERPTRETRAEQYSDIVLMAMVVKHRMKKQVMLHLLDCAEFGGIWDEDVFHPSSNFFSIFSGSVFLRGRPL